MKAIVFFLLFASCASINDRLPPWRKSASDTESFTEGLDSNSEDSAELRSEINFSDKVLSKMPPVEFIWPLKSPLVTDFFGWRKKRVHEGIDLRARTGTPIYAAAEGEVIYASRRVRNFGKLIVIDHGNGWSSLYAHLSKIEVRAGARVDKGERIGLSGRTGRVSGPHLHFEIRRGADPVDPLLFLN